MATRTTELTEDELDQIIICGLGKSTISGVEELVKKALTVLKKENCSTTFIEVHESLERLRSEEKVAFLRFITQPDHGYLLAVFSTDPDKEVL